MPGVGVGQVAVVVVAAFLLLKVVGEVVVEVAVAGEGAELEDGFGVVEAPAGAGDLHPVFDQPSAGAFDEAGGDGPAGGQEGGVVQVVLLVLQVGGGGVGAVAFLWAVAAAGGAAADAGGHVPGLALKDLGCLGLDPVPGLGVV